MQICLLKLRDILGIDINFIPQFTFNYNLVSLSKKIVMK